MTVFPTEWRWHWRPDGMIAVLELRGDGFWHAVIEGSTLIETSTSIETAIASADAFAQGGADGR